MDSIYVRLEKMLENLQISGNDFDLRCGFSKGYIRKVIRLKNDISYTKLLTILRVFEEYNPQWLLLGIGKMKSNHNKQADLLRPFIEIRGKYPAICVINKKGKVVYINDVYTKQTGFKLNEIKGKKPSDYLRCSEFPIEMDLKLQKILLTKSAAYEEIFPLYHKIGFPVFSDILIFPVVYNDNIEIYITFSNFKKKK